MCSLYLKNSSQMHPLNLVIVVANGNWYIITLLMIDLYENKDKLDVADVV